MEAMLLFLETFFSKVFYPFFVQQSSTRSTPTHFEMATETVPDVSKGVESITRLSGHWSGTSVGVGTGGVGIGAAIVVMNLWT